MPISAIAIEVPEAEPLVRTLRERHDPTARLGVPAHITVLVPFMDPSRLDTAVEQRLEQVFAGHAAFPFELSRVGRFPGVVYLVPEPATRFVALTEAMAQAFPEHPPYAGAHADIVPHLTVAHGDENEAEQVADELALRLQSHGPVRSTCRSVVLLENSTGRWRRVRCFDLSPASSR